MDLQDHPAESHADDQRHRDRGNRQMKTLRQVNHNQIAKQAIYDEGAGRMTAREAPAVRRGKPVLPLRPGPLEKRFQCRVQQAAAGRGRDPGGGQEPLAPK
jgi:hypothetical protein